MSIKSVFGGFELDRLLGVGATAEVFAAKNVSAGRDVALKVFSSVVSRDQELVERLQAESEILSRLRHPNVVATYGMRKHDEQFAIELELVNGVDLRRWMDSHRSSMPLFEPSLWMLAQVARGLGAAHEIEALHRDLKPENILISLEGDVKITDFGLARTVTRVTMTRVGLLVGSLGYLAPEVVNGERATPQSDLFSLGVMAYELLVSRSPFVGETPQALIQKLTAGIFTSTCEAAPHLPEEVGQVIDACLARDPLKRPQSVWEVEAVFMTALTQGPLLRFSKSLVAASLSTTDASDSALTEALRIKREWLIENARPENRSQILAEFHRLFPQDNEIGALILKTSTTSKTSTETKRRSLLAGAIVVGLAGLTLLNLDRCSTETPKNSTQLEAAAQTKTPKADANHLKTDQKVLVDSTRPQPVTKVAPKPVDVNGTLRFEVPEDVEVYVANVLVPRSELTAYKIAAGRYPMRMEKSGFLPIESTVDVKAGRVAVIRAEGTR